VIAEVRENQTFNPHLLERARYAGRRRRHRRELDLVGVRDRSNSRQTRIGISTYSALSSVPSRTMVGDPGSASRNCRLSLSI